MADTSAELNEIKELIATIQGFSGQNGPSPLLDWLAQSQGGSTPHLDHPRLCIFKASHGFATTQNLPQEMDYEKFTKDCLQGNGRLNRLALLANTDLRLYEMDPEDASDAEGDALTSADLVRSMAYGMMAVEPGLDLMAAGAFGHGSATSAKALIALHTGHTSDDLSVARLMKAAGTSKGLSALTSIGGYELAALCGAIIAARLANCPILLEGVQGYAAYLVLASENPALADHCRLCGTSDVKDAQLELSIPVITTSEPGLNLACMIQQLRTHVILNEGGPASASGQLSQMM